jgi:hypothetical protein
VLVLLGINIAVTVVFRADVDAQSGAYATGVLVLILSAAFAATLALWREARRRLSLYCGLVTIVFLYTLAENCRERPDGLVIGGLFILFVLTVSGVSRFLRATEMRVSEVTLAGAESEELQHEIIGKRVDLVPIRNNSHKARARKRDEIRRHYQTEGPFAFVHVELLDNRSEFISPLSVSIRREGRDYVVEVRQAIAIANTIAYLSELIDPRRIFLGLTRQNLMQQALRYLLLGEGETGLMVYVILLRYWEWTPEDDVRPTVFLQAD